VQEALGSRLAAVRAQVAEAAQRVGRDAAAVRIVAVTKGFPPAVVDAAVGAGLSDIGENYVQEARDKRAAAGASDAVWHLIGGLQRNKVRAALAVVDRIHSVDSIEIGRAVAAEAERLHRRFPVLVQVNVAGEASKRGAAVADVDALARAIAGMPSLVLEGMMTIAPAGSDPETSRPHFRRLRELRDSAQDRLGVELPHLSMGMSDDFVIAVEEGASLLRLGRVLFGPRGPRSWREGA